MLHELFCFLLLLLRTGCLGKTFTFKFFVKLPNSSKQQQFDDFSTFVMHNGGIFSLSFQFHGKNAFEHTVFHRILSMISISIRRLFGICLLRGATPKKDKDIRKGRGKLNFYKSSSKSHRYQKGRKSGYFVGWSSNGNNIQFTVVMFSKHWICKSCKLIQCYCLK